MQLPGGQPNLEATARLFSTVMPVRHQSGGAAQTVDQGEGLLHICSCNVLCLESPAVKTEKVLAGFETHI